MGWSIFYLMNQISVSSAINVGEVIGGHKSICF